MSYKTARVSNVLLVNVLTRFGRFLQQLWTLVHHNWQQKLWKSIQSFQNHDFEGKCYYFRLFSCHFLILGRVIQLVSCFSLQFTFEALKTYITQPKSWKQVKNSRLGALKGEDILKIIGQIIVLSLRMRVMFLSLMFFLI